MTTTRRYFRIEEYLDACGVWVIIGMRIPTREQAQIMAHHEGGENNPASVRISPENAEPYSLQDYAGRDAKRLRKKWKDAGMPDYEATPKETQ